MEVTDDSATRQRGTARDRVLDAARTLFSEYGVSGTSLQMIADHLGVTKAAVYHQFHTKEEIVVTLLEKPLAELEAVVTEAEAMDTREDQLDVLLKGLVDIVLENPEIVGMIQGDPAAARIAAGPALAQRRRETPHRSALRPASGFWSAGRERTLRRGTDAHRAPPADSRTSTPSQCAANFRASGS